MRRRCRVLLIQGALAGCRLPSQDEVRTRGMCGREESRRRRRHRPHHRRHADGTVCPTLMAEGTCGSGKLRHRDVRSERALHRHVRRDRHRVVGEQHGRWQQSPALRFAWLGARSRRLRIGHPVNHRRRMSCWSDRRERTVIDTSRTILGRAGTCDSRTVIASPPHLPPGHLSRTPTHVSCRHPCAD